MKIYNLCQKKGHFYVSKNPHEDSFECISKADSDELVKQATVSSATRMELHKANADRYKSVMNLVTRKMNSYRENALALNGSSASEKLKKAAEDQKEIDAILKDGGA